MYTHEIMQLMELKNYLISVKEYIHICSTSPQIREISYNDCEDKFMIQTEDCNNYKVYFKVYKEEK